MKRHVVVGEYKTVFQGKIFSVEQAEAVFPSGEKRIFERAKRSPTVIILAIDDRQNLLLNYEYRVEKKKYFWRLPTGRAEFGETPKKAAQRELMEETGFRAKKLVEFHLSDSNSLSNWQRFAFLGTNLEKVPPIGTHDAEEIVTKKVSLTKAFKMAKEKVIKEELMAYLIMQLYWNRKTLLNKVL